MEKTTAAVIRDFLYIDLTRLRKHAKARVARYTDYQTRTLNSTISSGSTASHGRW